ncbi:MAG: ferrous iron transport protein A [Caldilineales bacterium]|nr:ferrous iron transport protein A [Caldilineales bacterium]MDW8317158.1 ferrous iron transport protein A [Anaerolineae bacterium]
MPIETDLYPQAMPLSLAASGQTVTILQVNGVGSVRQRLFDLGLNRGAVVRVVQNDMSGPMILAVKEDGRLALGRGMAHHLLVMAVAADNG